MTNTVTQEMINAEYALLKEYASTLAFPQNAMDYFDSELAAYDKKDYANLKDKLFIIRGMRNDQYGLRD